MQHHGQRRGGTQQPPRCGRTGPGEAPSPLYYYYHHQEFFFFSFFMHKQKRSSFVGNNQGVGVVFSAACGAAWEMGVRLVRRRVGCGALRGDGEIHFNITHALHLQGNAAVPTHG